MICVIEYADRPSNKEQGLFSMLNQAFTEIRPNNLAVILNKCPNEYEKYEALEFY